MSDNTTAPAIANGLTPKPAAVIPRAHRLSCQASLPLEKMLLPLIRATSNGIVLIVAPPGGGKTTALKHLGVVLPRDAQVGLFDAHQAAEARESAASGLVVLAGVDARQDGDFLEIFELSPWTLDDCLEYLIATHRDQCAAVLARLGNDQSLTDLKGSPQFLSRVMDVMAGDPSPATAWKILRHQIRQIIPPGMALDRLILDGPLQAPLTNEQWRWWRHDEVKRICSADWIANQLCKGIIPNQLYNMDDGAPMVPDIAVAVKHQPTAIAALEQLIKSDGKSTAVPMAASILLAADPNWRPADKMKLNLANALLAGARWPGLDLAGSNLRGTRLTRANLSGASLKCLDADCTDLEGANMCAARLEGTSFANSNLKSADLSMAVATNANFSEANLDSTNLRKGSFHWAQFKSTRMSNVRAEQADFFGATFSDVDFDFANFGGSDFTRTKLQHIDLTPAVWTSASFAKSEFRDCNFEGLEMPRANFENADLTGCLLTASTIHHGKFRGANLTKTGLAEIDWAGADLRNANLTDASFHMGSTRSGLVGSLNPCEGSRTGFYTDDFNDRSYKPPEEIRKACLCGANLIGAEVERTDFYLVDLRRAVYSNAQAEHFSKSGAILRG